MSLFLIDAAKEWKGGQRQSFLVAEELQRRGYLFSFVVQPHSYLYRKALEADLPVFPLKMRSGLNLRGRLKLARAMKKNQCLLAHFHDGRSLAVISAAAHMAHVPIRILSRRNESSFRRRIFSKRRYLKTIDKIIAPTEGVRMMLVRSGIKRKSIEVIPYGIDFSPFDRAYSTNYFHTELFLSKDKYLVGILSHLPDKSSHQHLIQTAKILKQFTDRIKVIVVSDGPLSLDLRSQTRELDGDSMVYILGLREHLPHILSSLDMFVISSFPKGLGNSLLDAMACRLPVVIERALDIPNLIVHGETGVLVPPGDSSYLASAILALFKNRELAKRLGQKGYEFVQKRYSAQSMARNVVDLYERESEKGNIQLAKRV